MTEGLARVAVGQVVDVGVIYDEHQRDLYSFALAVTRDSGAAEDIVQEAFVRLIREHREGRSPDNPRAWLFTVSANLARTRARRRLVVDRWREIFGRASDADKAPPPDDAVLRRERRSELARALDSLSVEARTALLLAADGFSGEEIASILGRSPGATRNILWRSRLALRERLNGGGPR
jgi:RNA polymerase sigma-70 factor (ECF subfamily)